MLVIFLACGWISCKDFLSVKPQGALEEDDASSPKNVEGLVTAAYAWVAHEVTINQKLAPWLADIKSDDSYKGGGGLTDQSPWYQMEVFSLVTPNVGNNDGIWYGGYQGISRCNAALRALLKLDEVDFPLKAQRIAEMRFVRGMMYLQLKRWYKWIPYFDEQATADSIKSIPNHPDSASSDLYLWQHILEDFKAAAAELPATQDEQARPTRYAAEGAAVKCLMWMAYEQNDQNEVININKETLNAALTLIDDITGSGQYALTPELSHNYLARYDNMNPGSIWEWQYTHDDGTPNGNLNAGTALNAPWWPPYYSCCDFHKASYNMVNAFRVDDNGFPLYDTFNEAEITNKDQYFANNQWDPRIGHTVAIPGLPWKYQTDVLFDSSASRSPANYGYFKSMKDNVQAGSPYLVNLFWMWNSKNVIAIRYDRILLFKAEILIRLGREQEALPIINKIRQRAAASTAVLTFANGQPTLSYKIGLYEDGVNCDWTPAFAWKALMWENRLEFAMEGERWYDLVRWGIADSVMNEHFSKEKKRSRGWLKDAHFTKGRDEFMPIPEPQMHWSMGVYKQNVGY